ncbi:MAG: cytochrome c family protein [Planctomycetota bacterium]|nr:MAG: cytochrome c family protein [Planctomycetota bacterium]
MSARLPLRSAPSTDCVTIFLTGNELGALQPCGCSSGQLGGLDRRPAIFNSVPAERRLIVDTGSLVDGDNEQDLIKFDIVVQAFNLLDYDLVNLSGEDIEIAKSHGVLDNIASVFDVISSQVDDETDLPTRFTKQFLLKEKVVAVTVAAFDPESMPIEQIGELFVSQPGHQTVNMLILNSCTLEIVGSIAEMEIVDCIVCPPESDEPEVMSGQYDRPLVISVGRFGKYVGRLQITAAEDVNELSYSFLPVPVTEDLTQEKSLVEVYKAYQQLVKEENLLERQPRFTLSNGLEYTGSKSCKSCHEYEYKKWSGRAHAHAYATLERVGSHYDPECIICHVVGFEYESGFVSEQKSGEDLRNVGCENCHGPGSEHIRTLGQALTTEPMSDCTDCHTSERSADYAENEQLYFQKIVHWMEPNSVGGVKK